MSKYSKARQVAIDENDLMHYRLDALEKRLDSIEALVHGKLMTSGTDKISSELLQMMFDMMKQNMRPHNQELSPSDDAAPPTTKSHGSVQKSSGDDLAGFDTAACMARRRTIV